MEYLIFWGAMGLIVLFLAGQGVLADRREKKRFERTLYESYGKRPDKEYKVERFVRIPGYYEHHREPGQIDDITWDDLSMDQVFMRLNYTISSSGEEVLYYMLRTPTRSREELEYFDNVVTYFMEHPDRRVAFQKLMRSLGSTGKFSLYDYLEYLHTLGNRSNARDTIVNLLYIPAILLLFIRLPVGLAAIVVLMVYNIVTYMGIKREIEPYITSLAYIARLLATAQETAALKIPVCERENQLLLQGKKALNKSQRGSFWVFSKAGGTTGGSPLDILLDYVRMAFHVDLIFFNRMLREIGIHMEEIDRLITTLGYLESAVSIAMYRASLDKEGLAWCRPQLREAGDVLSAEQLYHPLIDHPVKNSISADGGVLLTGSNASGKSTFLKTVALGALMAQTLHMALAERYCAPLYRIYSSMSLRDDLESGESYYIVEIKSLKRILDARKEDSPRPVLCFVDEVLRGTNTVERIAAATQILVSLTGEGIQCFAATHDIELTELLSGLYRNYHFEEEIRDGDILFNYTLREGRANSRNAIRLLEIMGYDQTIIQKAQRQAEDFLQKGIWILS
jgi:Mismatch repair ATPase (MutS family)